jgi:hypothetical protein
MSSIFVRSAWSMAIAGSRAMRALCPFCLFVAVGIVALGCTGREQAGCPEPGCEQLSAERPLRVIALDRLAVCAAGIDARGESDLAAEDRLWCAFDVPRELGVYSALLEVRLSDGASPSPVVLSEEQLAGASALPIAYWASDAYPVTIRVSLGFRARAEAEDPADAQDPPNSGDFWWGFSQTFTRDQLRSATPSAPLDVGLPFDLWEVAVWPSAELGRSWSAGEVTSLEAIVENDFPIRSEALITDGATPSTMIPFRHVLRASRATQPTLEPFAREVITVPVFRGTASAASLRVSAVALEGATAIAAPGYFVLGLDGSLTPTAADALPALVGPPTNGDAGPAP